MKLTIKTLQQSNFKIDIEAEKTVKDLKDKIEADHGKDYPSGSQKLIYSGKILADESKLSEYNIDEKKFVVLMITRPPPVPKSKAASAASEKPTALVKEEPVTAASATTKAKASEDKPKTTAGQQSTTTTTSSSSTTAPSSTTTSADPSRNVFLPNQPAPNRSPAQNMRAMQQMGSQLANSLAMQSQFRQMQEIIQQRPHLLSSSIEALAGTDPELYNLISENPDAFVNALNIEPRQTSQQPQQQQQDSATRTRQTSESLISNLVNESDREAIERLKELGFSEHLAVQAYMACDKDENLAANLLLQMDQ